MISTFRYEECFKALSNQSEHQQPNTNFQDLLLGRIGHIYRQAQTSSSVALNIDLERYVDDRRRCQNEKFLAQQKNNLDPTQEAGALSNPHFKYLSSIYEDQF
jgi:hypothetical protein